MILRGFYFVAGLGVLAVVAIPVRQIVTTWMSATSGAGFADFSTLELALMGFIPIAFVFGGALYMVKRFLKGDEPKRLPPRRWYPPYDRGEY